MKIYTATQPGIFSEPMVDSEVAQAFLDRRHPGAIKTEQAYLRHCHGQDLTGKTLLVMRRGGYGDLLWLTRVIRKLKTVYLDLTVWVACFDRHHMVFHGNPDISRLLPYPFPLRDFDAADYHLSLEGVVERERSGRSVYDLAAEVAGVTLDEDEKVPVYSINHGSGKRIRKWMRSLGVSGTNKKVMIHMGASTPWKSWPDYYCLTLAANLGKRGVKVFLAGNANNIDFYKLPPMGPNVINCCYREKDVGGFGVRKIRDDFWTIEESVALLARMDLLIGQDSGLTHFAAALNVPCFAIYGPFPASAYVSTYPLTFPIENPSGCKFAPCYPHLDRICPITDDNGFAPCLKSILPITMYELAMDHLGLKTIEMDTVVQEAAAS